MIYLIIAIITILIANILKVLRQSLFIDLYDDSNKKNLTQALSVSNLINYIIPFKLGYIYRAYFTGKKDEVWNIIFYSNYHCRDYS